MDKASLILIIVPISPILLMLLYSTILISDVCCFISVLLYWLLIPWFPDFISSPVQFHHANAPLSHMSIAWKRYCGWFLSKWLHLSVCHHCFQIGDVKHCLLETLIKLFHYYEHLCQIITNWCDLLWTMDSQTLLTVRSVHFYWIVILYFAVIGHTMEITSTVMIVKDGITTRDP